jgi:hypothetical protein
MTEKPEPTPELPHIRLQVRAGATLALRLLIRNRMMAAALLRPTADNWVVDDGQILPTGSRLDPAYIYLLQGGEARQTLTLLVPSHLPAGTTLKSSLRFPGVQEEAIPLDLEILAPTGEREPPRLLEYPLSLSLPLGGSVSPSPEALNGAAEASYSLVAGLAGLDMIPARWLVAELLAVLCQAGEDYAGSEAAGQLLVRLGRTRFFKNGVLAFASAQVPRWILSGLSASSGLHAALGGQMGQGRLLYIWERWLLSLAEVDLEADPKRGNILVPDSTLQAFASEVGTSPDRWFGNLLLGLARVSPRVAATLEAIAARAPVPAAEPPRSARPPDDVIGEGESIQR